LTELDRKKEQTPVPKEWAYAPAPESRDVVSIEDRYGHFVGGQWLEPSETYTTIDPSSEDQRLTAATQSGMLRDPTWAT